MSAATVSVGVASTSQAPDKRRTAGAYCRPERRPERGPERTAERGGGYGVGGGAVVGRVTRYWGACVRRQSGGYTRAGRTCNCPLPARYRGVSAVVVAAATQGGGGGGGASA